MKLYIDTNIFLDYLLERKNLNGEDISLPAQKLFYRAMSCEFFIIYSDHTATELAKQIDLTKTTFLFEALNKKLIPIAKSEEDIKKSIEISNNNSSDALHSILAKKAEADYLITRNIKHFKEFDLIIKSKLPEDI